MSTQITIGSNTYTLIALPAAPGVASIELGMNDQAAVNTSPFTGVQQIFTWPGADHWDATITLPPMYAATAAPWRGALAELRGKANVFQLGDPSYSGPRGTPTGTPVAGGTAYNPPMADAFVTQGWTVSTLVLRAGDQIQIGYRLHIVCEDTTSDVNGNATIPIWPSLRETPAYLSAIITASPVGLFRLADNRRAINWSPSKLVTVSIKAMEAR